MTEHARWSLGTLIGFPILLVCTIAGLALARFAWGLHKRDREKSFYDKGWLALTVVGRLIALIFGVITVVGMYPYRAEYHQWQPIDGRVEAISSRILGSGKTVTQRFVVTFASGATRACDDTRCALVKPGDALSLTCKRSFQYAGEDGYDCNYVAHTPRGTR